jgi:hypothetical protein
MRVGRAILIPAILTLSVAGSVLSGTGMAVAAAHPPTVQVHVIGSFGITNTYYHG